MLLAIATQNDYFAIQFDIKTAFLYGELAWNPLACFEEFLAFSNKTLIQVEMFFASPTEFGKTLPEFAVSLEFKWMKIEVMWWR